jgi:hypothetical protein
MRQLIIQYLDYGAAGLEPAVVRRLADARKLALLKFHAPRSRPGMESAAVQCATAGEPLNTLPRRPRSVTMVVYRK